MHEFFWWNRIQLKSSQCSLSLSDDVRLTSLGVMHLLSERPLLSTFASHSNGLKCAPEATAAQRVPSHHMMWMEIYRIRHSWKTLYIKNFCLLSENRRLPSNHYTVQGGASRPQIAMSVIPMYGIQVNKIKVRIFLAWNPITIPKSSINDAFEEKHVS